MAEREYESSLETRIVRLEERQKNIRTELAELKEQGSQRTASLEKRVAEIDMTLQRIQWRQQNGQSQETTQRPLAQGLSMGNFADPMLLRVIAILAAALAGVAGGDIYFGD